MKASSTLELPSEYRERGAYIISGDVRIGGESIQPQTLPVFLPQGTVKIEADTEAHLVIIGGEPLPEERFIWRNYVSTSKERIEQAKHDWAEGKFGKIPGDEKEFVPLPVEKNR